MMNTMSYSTLTPADVLEYAKKSDAKQLDLRFTDLPGLQHHICLLYTSDAADE